MGLLQATPCLPGSCVEFVGNTVLNVHIGKSVGGHCLEGVDCARRLSTPVVGLSLIHSFPPQIRR